MISKNLIKFIKSLQLKKYRQQEQLFLVEGAKSVLELLHSDFEIKTLIVGSLFFEQNKKILLNRSFEIYEEKEDILTSISSFQNNNAAIAIAKSKPNQPLNINKNEYAIALDDIQDPGNLGTIVRISDWYGINKIICSLNSAEFYNPKVISATMGSFTRAMIYYCDLEKYLKDINSTVYGAVLSGENVHTMNFNTGGIVLIGNESRGIQERLLTSVDKKITIPSFGRAESLNAAIATAVICDNIRRIISGK